MLQQKGNIAAKHDIIKYWIIIELFILLSISF